MIRDYDDICLKRPVQIQMGTVQVIQAVQSGMVGKGVKKSECEHGTEQRLQVRLAQPKHVCAGGLWQALPSDPVAYS